MTGLLIALSCIAFPLAIGWLYGRKDIDPNTPEGRRYYAKGGRK